MKNIVLVSLPKVETAFPPAALSVLSSVAAQNQFDVRIFDFNLDLFRILESSHWDDLESWCTFSMDSIDGKLEQQIKEIFLEKLSQIIDQDTAFVCFSVFSYFSNRIAVNALQWYQSKFKLPSIVGGSGVSTDVDQI